jgi:hypothetical protein
MAAVAETQRLHFFQLVREKETSKGALSTRLKVCISPGSPLSALFASSLKCRIILLYSYRYKGPKE